MGIRVLFTALGLLLAAPLAALADQAPTYNGPLSASERRFVGMIQADLGKRFPTSADAVQAGYVRYTNEDDTGAISYANFRWRSVDSRHPSQLWYDKHGALLGADFSVPNTDGKRPHLFGVNPGRWYAFDDHVHYVQRSANGSLQYDKYIMAAPFKAAGGDPAHPSKEDLVKMGRVKEPSQVATVFDMPSIWDLIVWIKPNPSGAFAEKNPLVKR
jgi:hypothetical protein